MTKKILIIDGHPDPSPERFDHGLTDAYCGGARDAGHEVRIARVATLEFPWLRSSQEFIFGKPPKVIIQQQQLLTWSEHVVIIYPLWLGAMPAMLKAYFEQLLRPGFAFAAAKGKGFPQKLLKGRSARIFVTMGMPSLFYKLVYRAHSLKSLERNILGAVGFKPVRATVIGNIEGVSSKERKVFLANAAQLGARAM